MLIYKKEKDTPMHHYPLEVQNLTKSFFKTSWFLHKSETFTAVNNISFNLQEGEILGLLGPNGAGKTTTIHMLIDILTPTSGTIVYFGKDFLRYRSNIFKSLAYASGYDKLPGRLTVWENLDIFGRLYGISYPERYRRIKVLLERFALDRFSNKSTATLSAGQATRVMLAKAFLPNPKIVLLDEPTATLDPEVAQEVRRFILEQKEQEGTSIIFTSHNMAEVTELCDRVLMIKSGTIIADSNPAKLAASVKKARLQLIITEGQNKLLLYLQEKQIPHNQEAHQVNMEIDEALVGELLVTIARQGISYSHITLDKPTLEDYFLLHTQAVQR
ncbi:MAG TPA: ABC transporter ATP-binding protein [Candidatus Babeliaceae bacterium]|nr:ABC transporter ATP-binding protein [Candidatus Babeliaceae bacterium]